MKRSELKIYLISVLKGSITVLTVAFGGCLIFTIVYLLGKFFPLSNYFYICKVFNICNITLTGIALTMIAGIITITTIFLILFFLYLVANGLARIGGYRDKEDV